MDPWVFAVAALTAIATYRLMEGRMARGARVTAVARLGGAAPVRRVRAAESGPLLTPDGAELRGRLARRLLDAMHVNRQASRMLESAGLKWSAAGLLHRSAALFLAGFWGTTLLAAPSGTLLALAVGSAAGAVPWWYVRRTANQRILAFEEQFPDCLEFISRSMRAGHAFSVALEMVPREFSEPLAPEFRRVYEEQHLGQPLDLVLKKLSERVPSLDVQFFVSAVLLQKRTGGNLAELLDKLANLMRERFKLRARIRAISAQGLMSGRILAAIPAGVGALMFVVNPSYARFFVDDPVGHQLLAAALALLIFGYLIIKRIVTIEV
jgi:tight adherence protein B